jgi:hypothetical protein
MRNHFAIATAICLFITPSLVSARESVDSRGTQGTEARVERAQGERALPTRAGVSTTKSDKARYQARDASSAEAQAFKGGDTVVIGTTALVVVLLVVVILVLL